MVLLAIRLVLKLVKLNLSKLIFIVKNISNLNKFFDSD